MPSLNALPAGHNTVNPFAIVPDALGFIRFVEGVFEGQESTHVRTPDRDGSIIHAEVVVGDSTIMLCDSKLDWPFTPVFLQVYVEDAQVILEKAVRHGAEIVTPISSFYGGYRIARVLDPWRNVWWIYEPTDKPLPQNQRETDVEWHENNPSLVYTSLMTAMRNLSQPSDHEPSVSAMPSSGVDAVAGATKRS